MSTSLGRSEKESIMAALENHPSPPATTTTTTETEINPTEKENLSVMLANEHYINVMVQMLRDSKPEAQLVIAQAMRSLCIHPQVEH